MTKVLSLKIKEDIFEEVEEITKRNKIPRNFYINQALLLYNKLNKRRLLKNQLKKESLLTQGNSLKILEEFEKLEDEILE
jgi:hypothetical protein